MKKTLKANLCRTDLKTIKFSRHFASDEAVEEEEKGFQVDLAVFAVCLAMENFKAILPKVFWGQSGGFGGKRGCLPGRRMSWDLVCCFVPSVKNSEKIFFEAANISGRLKPFGKSHEKQAEIFGQQMKTWHRGASAAGVPGD